MVLRSRSIHSRVGHFAEGDHGEGGVGGLYPIVVVVGVVVWGHTISEAGAWDGACGGLKDTEDALEGGFDGRKIADIEADQGGFGGVVGFARAGVGAEVSGRDRGEQAAWPPMPIKPLGVLQVESPSVTKPRRRLTKEALRSVAEKLTKIWLQYFWREDLGKKARQALRGGWGGVEVGDVGSSVLLGC